MRSLFDNHGREINYLRLAVTDRCNLRCFYCMPEKGIDYVKKKALLTYEEMLRLVQVGSQLGITKLRITGGEPFVRRDMMDFLRNVCKIHNLEVHLTTNGILTAPLIPELKSIGLKSINLSLDTLDRDRFKMITRRDNLLEVKETMQEALKHGIKLKTNTVVMDGKNIEDLIPMAELARNAPIHVRFIEEMPFNGTGSHYKKLHWNHQAIFNFLKSHYPEIEQKNIPAQATAQPLEIPGFQGKLGIIAAYSRTFCGTCNRIRVTPTGMLKTCLYDNGVFNVKELMRAGASDDQLKDALTSALHNRNKNGFEAENNRLKLFPISESMSTIGG